jgi:hypothetical protein
MTPENDADRASLVQSRLPQFQEILNNSRKSIKTGKGLSREYFWQAAAEPHNSESKTTRSLEYLAMDLSLYF